MAEEASHVLLPSNLVCAFAKEYVNSWLDFVPTITSLSPCQFEPQNARE